MNHIDNFYESVKTEMTPPLAFEKQSNMDDWLILDKIEDVCIGTGIPYNYESSKL